MALACLWKSGARPGTRSSAFSRTKHDMTEAAAAAAEEREGYRTSATRDASARLARTAIASCAPNAVGEGCVSRQESPPDGRFNTALFLKIR